jgi:DNA repair protein RadC
MQPQPPGTVFESSKEVERRYRRRLAHEERELCYVLALDTRHRLLREALVSVGGLNGVGVEPRDVFAPVVRERAASAIVIHNHPSGVPEASAEDLALAVRLWRAAGVLGVKLLDFVVVAREGCTSLADLGLLADGDDSASTRIVRYRRYARAPVR